MGCLPSLPPADRAIDIIGPERGCPEQFAGCLDVDGGVALAEYISALRRYSREAAARCYVAPDGGM